MYKKLYTLALAGLSLCATSALAQVNVTADPADGSLVEELSSVVLTFNDYDLVDLGAKASDITLTSDKGYSVNCSASYGDADNQMKITFAKVTEEATYQLNVVENAFIYGNGVAVPAFTLTYTVGTEAPAATLTPAPGQVSWLTKLIYNYDIEKSLNADNYSGGKATLTTPTGEVENLLPEYDWQIGNGKYTLRVLNLHNEAGEYTVTIPDNLFYCYDDNYNKVNLPGGTYTYQVTGGELTQIEAEPAGEVYQFNAFKVTFPGYETIAKNTTSSIYVCRVGKEGTVTQISMDYNVQVEGNALVHNNAYSTYIDPGHYYIAFPEGCVLLGGADGQPCTPFQIEFDIVEPQSADIVITPAEGQTVSMLHHALVSFPDEEYVTLNSSASVNLYQVDGESRNTIAGAYGQSSILRVNDNTFDVRFNGLATTDGEYIIALTKNSFSFANGSFNQEYEVKVNFVAPEAPVMTITPAPGTELDKIKDFVVTFPEETVVKLNEKLSNKSSVLYNGTELVSNGWGGYANAQAGSTSVYTPVEGTTNAFAFSLSQAVINKGDYLLVMPVGLFLIGEDETSYNAAFQAQFSATGEGVDKVVVNPNHPVQKLEELCVTYVNEEAIYFQTEYTGFSLYKVNPDSSWDDYKEYISGENRYIEGNTLYFIPTGEYTEAGEYYIEISNWSLFMTDGVTASTAQKVYWTVDPEYVPVSISEVKAQDDQRTYNLQGIEVRNAQGLIIRGGKLMMSK